MAAAVGAATAHLRYITRDDAAQPGDVIARSNGAILDGSPADLKAAAREAIDKRSQRHTDAYGVRLADRKNVTVIWNLCQRLNGLVSMIGSGRTKTAPTEVGAVAPTFTVSAREGEGASSTLPESRWRKPRQGGPL